MSLPSLKCALLLAFVLAACRPAQQAPAGREPTDAPRSEPALPVAEPALDREALLLMQARAASAAALGQDDGKIQADWDGQRFEVRLRFGCNGATASNATAPRRWTVDGERRVLRLHVAPDIDSATPLIEAVGGPVFEAVEGFWIERPWQLADGCPQARAASSSSAVAATSEAGRPAPTVAPQLPRVGIAQFFTQTDPRTHRRDHRAYEATETIDPDEQLSASGYNLVLSGRLRLLPNGRVIACVVDHVDAPPACVASVKFDKVAIELPDREKTLAEWAAG